MLGFKYNKIYKNPVNVALLKLRPIFDEIYSKGKERQIVTGGSISGNVNLSLDTVRFTNETIQHNNYIGPRKVMLDNVSINKG